jgi:hypothetical protein
MRKGQPKRRDLRKRIAELEQEVLRLDSKLRTQEVAASRYPVRYTTIQRYYIGPFASKPELDKLGTEKYRRRDAIRACALSLAATIAYNTAEITERKWPDGWRSVQMTVTFVPPFEQNAPEIREAIEEIKREDTA